GAKPTLDALEAGAADFLPKRFEDISLDRDEARRVLCARVRAIATRGLHRWAMRANGHAPPPAAQARPGAPPPSRPNAAVRPGEVRLVAIGTSTGGPVALQQVLTVLPANFPVPLVLIQHMPAAFTPAFAERLNQLCKIQVKEAADGDALLPGRALLAPGG